MQVAADVAIGAAQVVADTARIAGRAVRGVVGSGLAQLPRLARLERVEADTRVSLALLLEERTRKNPDDTFFLFAGRAYSYADGMHRIDAVTRGLVGLGVRQGEHVGVLMRTRPTALAVIAAISRLGAVAVMLRPAGDLRRELRLGQVNRVVADPDHVAMALVEVEGQVLVLGAALDGRAVPDGLSTWRPSTTPPWTCRTGMNPTPGAPGTSHSSCSPVRGPAPGPTGSPIAAGRCRRSGRRRRHPWGAATPCTR